VKWLAVAAPEALALLREADAELRLGLSESQLQCLLNFVDLLGRWNAVYNLTAVREPLQMIRQHVADCLAVLGPLRSHLGDLTGKRLLDVGSGGGLPGAVLAIAVPTLEVTCIDAVRKKSTFVRQVASELRLGNLASVHARIEHLSERRFDVITARAFASLADLVASSRTLLRPGGVWMAMKGGIPNEELQQLPLDVKAFHVEQIKVPGLDAKRCLVWIRSLSAHGETSAAA
jgi:16S rRNA (guanine527-N7)-methyltransferase